MGKKDKLRKFAELQTFSNVYQNLNYTNPTVNQLNTEVEVKGKWNSVVFKNNYPIVLELACGKGEYSIGLSKIYPNKNFIGVDLKGNRIWRGAKTALEEKLEQVRFLRSKIELLPYFFEENEVDEIWIIFPDPHLKEKREKHRLTSANFLKVYNKILKPNARINLKTDSPELYAFTLDTIERENLDIHENNTNIYAQESIKEELNIKTYYEGKHLEKGRIIRYIQFSIPLKKDANAN